MLFIVSVYLLHTESHEGWVICVSVGGLESWIYHKFKNKKIKISPIISVGWALIKISPINNDFFLFLNLGWGSNKFISPIKTLTNYKVD